MDYLRIGIIPGWNIYQVMIVEQIYPSNPFWLACSSKFKIKLYNKGSSHISLVILSKFKRIN